jgi:hypothetical protein
MNLRFERFAENPIITPETDGTIGSNINGPSLIRVPDWVEEPLGRYYLYFAHHRGRFIRLAYADRLSGPWQIYAPGTLRLEETVCQGHIASPDVHVCEGERELWMFFHGPYEGEQVTFLATSSDGLRFSAGQQVLGPFYFRVFRHGDWHYAIAKHHNVDGRLLRSPEGRTPFEAGPHILPRVRHVALRKSGAVLQIFCTRTGDSPERILLAEMPLMGDWRDWRPSEPATVLRPEMAYEGATLPHEPSQPGPVNERVCQLRDPAIFEEADKTYLFYAVAGESGIAAAEVLGAG